MALLVDQIAEAQKIYRRAAKELGPDLGGWGLKDLLADNTDWSLRNIDDVIACLGMNILRHFPRLLVRIKFHTK